MKAHAATHLGCAISVLLAVSACQSTPAAILRGSRFLTLTRKTDFPSQVEGHDGKVAAPGHRQCHLSRSKQLSDLGQE